jgi:hypothetical protein
LNIEATWNSDGHTWLRVLARLPKLYRQVGREEDARKVEEELLRLLSQADPDHATLLALRKARESEIVAVEAVPRR